MGIPLRRVEWAAAFLAVLTLTCSVAGVARDEVAAVRGGGSVAGCNNCLMQHWTFYECYHESETDSCRTYACMENHYWTFKCSTTLPEQQDHCQYEINNNLLWRYQVVRNTSGLTCPDNGMEDISELCASKCRPMIEAGVAEGECHQGRCLLSSCSGTFWKDNDGVFTGRYECDP